MPGDAEVLVPLIEVRDLVKRFDGHTVLDGIDLRVDRGETVAVIGGSGSGKTTLARLIMGLDKPTSGAICVDGVDVASLPPRALAQVRRRFAMVFQSAALLDSLTVLDNVAFPLRETTRMSDDEICARALVKLRELGVEDAADKVPSELSGGMAKRVGIARAMVTEPEVLVYDEPTSGLDPITSRTVDGLVESMRERFFVTSIVITHDMVTAFEVADRVVLLSEGKIRAEGPPEQIFHSHGADLLPFALSSGVDLERLAPRSARKPAAEIRAAWTASRAPEAPETPRWYGRLRARRAGRAAPGG